MKVAIIVATAVVLLSGCASNKAYEAAQRVQDAKYNRCADRIHAMQKDGERVNWSLEIDACMGRKGDEYQQYQSGKATTMPTRAEWDAKNR
jgi:outer membrane murein-binding lipoprotein Lpp